MYVHGRCAPRGPHLIIFVTSHPLFFIRFWHFRQDSITTTNHLCRALTKIRVYLPKKEKSCSASLKFPKPTRAYLRILSCPVMESPKPVSKQHSLFNTIFFCKNWLFFNHFWGSKYNRRGNIKENKNSNLKISNYK